LIFFLQLCHIKTDYYLDQRVGVNVLRIVVISSILLTFLKPAVSNAGVDFGTAADTGEAGVFKISNVSGEKFNDFYTDADNYGYVYRKVMSWFGSTNNACVAFASTALRELGVDIPQNGIWNGERLSLLTKPFSSYLQNKLGWLRINDSRSLQPGDLVFTVDERKAPGYPAHVYMHAGYADDNRAISWAVDNQGFTHERALAGDLKKDYSAFAYALRSPVE
jgi:hypothetical protein